MILESKYCSDVIKKHFNKEVVITKEDNEFFKNSTKCQICDNDYIGNDVKVRGHCRITEKYRGSAHRDCNVYLKSNHEIFIVFRNLKNYVFHVIIQEKGNSNPKVSAMSNGLEKYMSFTMNNRLCFIDSFQFRSSALDSLVKMILSI